MFLQHSCFLKMVNWNSIYANWRPLFWNNSMVFSLIILTSSNFSPPVTSSSTYMSVSITSIILAYACLQFSKCFFKVPSRMKGDCVKPKINLLNQSISIFVGSRFWIQWKRSAFWVSPQSNTGRNIVLIRISHNKFCKLGPVSRQ